jgi:hypothetical protein
MNPTSRAILQTVLATDASLAVSERSAVQRLIDGQIEVPGTTPASDERVVVTQKRAAELLSVSRATIWRMTKDCVLHPVEIIPGTWRYPFREIIMLARKGVDAATEAGAHREKSAA